MDVRFGAPTSQIRLRVSMSYVSIPMYRLIEAIVEGKVQHTARISGKKGCNSSEDHGDITYSI